MTMNNDEKIMTGETDFLSDCRIMLRFARQSGASLAPELQREIAQLDGLLIGLTENPISNIPGNVLSSGATSTGAAKEPAISGENVASDSSATASQPLSVSELILKVHEALAKLIAPATPLSLQLSEPPPGRRTIFGGMPKIVKWAAVIATISAFGFVVSAGVIAKMKLGVAETAKKEKSAVDKKKAGEVETAAKSAKAADDRKAEGPKAETKDKK